MVSPYMEVYKILREIHSDKHGTWGDNTGNTKNISQFWRCFKEIKEMFSTGVAYEWGMRVR